MDLEEPTYQLTFTDSDGSTIWSGEVTSVEFTNKWVTHSGPVVRFWAEDPPDTGPETLFEEKTKSFDGGFNVTTFNVIRKEDFESALVEVDDL